MDIFLITASAALEAEDMGPCHVDIAVSLCPQRVPTLVGGRASE